MVDKHEVKDIMEDTELTNLAEKQKETILELTADKVLLEEKINILMSKFDEHFPTVKTEPANPLKGSGSDITDVANQLLDTFNGFAGSV
jgi:hypothetical protein